ncbi:head decoration protein [Tropicibacter sp. R16_0]|uniref:head decoration protein n=1 Tax=Tropicibacter sp. R16_0 TaxID=2821102 RepID=UPI001ADBF2CB|nr:head decoration protein [Tropicibacter sp. R16_0]MBO9451451.1 head decoration protein [Tropicibacter sp. R16_0]
MPPVLTEGKTPGDWLMYEAPSHYSRESEIITGGNYESGTVLGRITADKKLTVCDPGASDGSEVAVSVLHTGVDASTTDAPGLTIARHAQVSRMGLTFGAGFTTTAQRDAAVEQLKSKGIVAI